jgi:hypothetical protein
VDVGTDSRRDVGTLVYFPQVSELELSSERVEIPWSPVASLVTPCCLMCSIDCTQFAVETRGDSRTIVDARTRPRPERAR